ncbi:MAG: type IV pilus secretin PilQ [Gammaproteobacteria bacterium]|nr:type IV pilus secretin PilQ [Gammaproteobacteria bacterium]
MIPNRLKLGVRRAHPDHHPATRVAAAILLLATLLLSGSAFAAESELTELSYATIPGKGIRITLTTDGTAPTPTSFTTENPARIALDFPGMSSGLEKKSIPIGIGVARSVTVVESGGRTRIVVNLVKQVPHEITTDDNHIYINLQSSAGLASSDAPQSFTDKVARAANTSNEGTNRVEDVDFRRGDEGEGRIIIQLSDPSTVIDMRDEGGRVVLDIKDTFLPEKLNRKFDVTDFATPVKTVEVTAQGNNIHMVITPTGFFEHLAYQTDDLLTIEFRPLTDTEQEEIKRKKETFTGERLSLNFQDIEVRSVLQLLADFTGLNLVTSDTVQGRITLRLQNVPWDQALNIIMKTRGLSMRKNGNVIMVAPTEEIVAREKLELESEKQIEELAPLHSEYMQINYAKAADLRDLLKTEGNELLTPGRGNVTVDERTNTLLVLDTAAKLEDIRRLVKKLDIAVRQVMIESRIVIAEDNFSRDIGVRFGFNRANTSNGNEALIAGGATGHLSGTDALDTGLFMGTGAGISSGDSGDPANAENLMVSLPADIASGGGAVNLLVGKVGSYLMQLELSALEQEGRGEVISSPRIITSDQTKATIKQGQEIPYQEASSSGATSTSFKEAVLQLDVTPQITPDDHINMEIKVTKDQADYARRVGLNAPPINTRSVETVVLVNNGETVVLGGIFERTKGEAVDRIPWLGSLPGVGFFFRNTVSTDDNTELLIFITPKILKDTLSLR